MKKRIYSTEFKEQTARLSYQQHNIKLSLDPQRIYKWRKGAKEVQTSNHQKIVKAASLEVEKLRKALKEKELELEILKKAVHIFSKNDGKSISL